MRKINACSNFCKSTYSFFTTTLKTIASIPSKLTELAESAHKEEKAEEAKEVREQARLKALSIVIEFLNAVHRPNNCEWRLRDSISVYKQNEIFKDQRLVISCQVPQTHRYNVTISEREPKTAEKAYEYLSTFSEEARIAGFDSEFSKIFIEAMIMNYEGTTRTDILLCGDIYDQLCAMATQWKLSLFTEEKVTMRKRGQA